MRHALSRLVFEGLIIRQVGRGSFVAPLEVDRFPIDTAQCVSFEDQVARQGKVVTYREASYGLTTASSDVAKQLGVEPGTDVFKLERLRVIDGRPVCIEVRYLPPALGRRVTGDMLAMRSVHDFVSEITGARVPTIVVLISAIMADAVLADRLDVARGGALLVRDHVYFDRDGLPLLCGKSLFRGDLRTEFVLGPDLRQRTQGVNAS